MIRKTAATLALGAALLAALAGCSSASTQDTKSTPKPSETTTATETVYNECIDGLATVNAADVTTDKSPMTIGDCAQVSVVGQAAKGTKIVIGAVDDLLVEASGAVIDVQSAKAVTVPGSTNTVTYGGESAVQDLGKDNAISAR